MENNDMLRAKALLASSCASLALVRGETELISYASGISPMLDFMLENKELCGFCAADKIVGRAAAFLFALAKVREVYAEVLSEGGKRELDRLGIKNSCKTLVNMIINRTGDGQCPMECAVADINDPQAAFSALVAARARLRGEA